MDSALVGRVTEVAALDRARASAAGGSGACALLTGEAGIGKTAVAEEAVSLLVARRTDLLSPGCRELLGGAAALGEDVDVPVLRHDHSRPGGRRRRRRPRHHRPQRGRHPDTLRDRRLTS